MTFKEYKDKVWAGKDILSVKNLNCSFKGLTDLQGIQDFKNIESLDIYNNHLTSLDELKELKHLRIIFYTKNPIPKNKLYRAIKDLEMMKEEAEIIRQNLLEERINKFI